MNEIFFYITVLAYIAASTVYAVFLIKKNDGLQKTARWILTVGFAFHTLTIIFRWGALGHTPATTFHDSLTFFSWVVVFLYGFLLFKYKQKVLGAFVAPFALILILGASLLPRKLLPLSPVLDSSWLPVHIVIAFMGNAFFAIAFFLGVMYIIQAHYLKTRSFKGLFHILPPLEIIDELNYKCLQWGFPLLTLAIITGAIWSEYTLGSYWTWKPRQILSLITWFMYAALLHGRLTAGWRGKKAAILSGAAFVTLVGSYVVINLLLGGGHGF